jgi:hypothetical protein
MHKWTIKVEEETPVYSLNKFSPIMYRECSICGYRLYHLHDENDRDLPSCEIHKMNEALK